MVRSIGAQLGLLAFTVAIVAGLVAGNSVTTVLIRALLVMLAACVIGQAVGWAGKLALREHLQRKKLQIDCQHRDADRASGKPQPKNSESPAPAEGG